MKKITIIKLALSTTIIMTFLFATILFFTSDKNPILQEPGLPKFDLIKPEHFKPAVDQTIKEHRTTVEKLLKQKEYTWENFVDPLEEANERLHFVWAATIGHLKLVNGTEEIRKAYEECLPITSKYFAELSQNEKIYQAFEQIYKSDHYQSLDCVQKKIISDALRDFQLAGVNLPPKKKKRFTELKERYSELSNQFSNNVLDATQKHLIKISEKEAQKLPETVLALAREKAKKHNYQGLIFTLDFPAYNAIRTFADSRDLRKKVYIAYITRASDKSNNKKLNNSKIIEEIIKIRKEIAETLGFKNYAEYNIADKSVKSTEQVINFIHELAKKSLPKARKELSELKDLAKKDGIKKLESWDIYYYAEKLKQQKFAVSEEELKPYFPLLQAITGAFAITQKLYGITFKKNKNIPAWHQDVLFYEMYGNQDKLQGYLYIDPYYRDNKQGGAWAKNAVNKYVAQNGKTHLPIAYLTCNFTPPTDGKPSLLTHEELTTFLHELGHSLQFLLTKYTYPSAAVNSIPCDTIEIASQFMENYAWQEESIALLSKHYKNGNPLPKNKLKKLLGTKTFISAILMLRQLEFALGDFNLHLEQPATIQELQNIINKARKQIGVTPVYQDDRLFHSFHHIFAGGYAAGYYGYKWSEVMAADAFSKFEKQGILNRKTGQEFLDEFLSQGGSEDPLVLFENFRGRPPSVESLLKQAGIMPK